MIAADRPDRRPARLLVVEAAGTMRDLPRHRLATLFDPGDLVVANDAATLPASLHGTHVPSGEAIEIRLAGWLSLSDPTRFVAIAFGLGDHRMRTEDRPPPPALSAGDRVRLGPLKAVVERVLDHTRMFELHFLGSRAAVLAGLAQHGRPIQYAHVPEPLVLWDVWTKIAAGPVAFEAPSAGFALDWRTLQAWRRRGVGFATLTHAAGVSSTGDPALDSRLPFDEPYPSLSIPRLRSRGRSSAAAASLRSARASCAPSRQPPIPMGACAREMALRQGASRGARLFASSMRFSRASTSLVKAISSSCAPSPTMPWSSGPPQRSSRPATALMNSAIPCCSTASHYFYRANRVWSDWPVSSKRACSRK